MIRIVEPFSLLARGTPEHKVRLVELGPEQRIPVLREFPARVPRGVPFMLQAGAVAKPGDADAFEAAGASLAGFRVDPVPA